MRKLLLAALAVFLLAAPAWAAYDIDQYLNIKYAKNGHFSLDEKWIAYLSNQSGTYQIWRISVDGGQPEQLTDFEDAIDNLAFSPTEDKILFTKDSGGDENYQLYLMDADGKNVTALTDRTDCRVNTPHFSPDGKSIAFTANFRDTKYFDVHTLDLNTRKHRMVRKVNGYNLIEEWSPTGDRLVVSTWENNYNNNLYMVDLTSGEHVQLTPHTGWATYSQIAWPKDKTGKKVISNVQRDDIKKEIEFLDSAPWDTHNLCLSGDSRVLAYTLNTHGYSMMFLVDREKQKYWAKPKTPKGVIKNVKLTKNGDRALFTFSSPLHNTDLWIYDVKQDQVRRLTHSPTGDIDPATFIEPETVQFVGAYGKEIPAFFYKPPGAKKDGTLPCLIYMHGGPESQERPDFSMTFQYFLNRGFGIFAPNVRGSSGYGKGYMHLDDGPMRPDAVRDVAMGVSWLSKVGHIDPKRVGVYGGSYGGYMVLALMTEHPSLFAAGVNIVGISNFVTFLERTHPSRRSIREAEYGSLSKDKHFLEQISPIHRIEKMTGALMVIHGAKDPRVPQHEADQVVQKAKETGIEVEYLLYADEGHGLSKLKNKIDAYPKMAAFFEKHLAPQKEEPEPADDPEPQDTAAPAAP